MRKWFGGGGSEDSDDSPGTFGNLALDRVLPQARGPLIRENIATVPVRLESPARQTPDDPPLPRRGFLRVAVYFSLAVAFAAGALGAGVQNANAADEGSLWDARTGFRYTNRKAMRVGDVITVRVSESSSGSNRSSLSASKEHKLEAGGGPGTGKLDFLPLFGFDSNMKNELDGSGAVSVSGQLTTTLTVTVREILPNGHLVVEGSRLITLNGEEERVSLHGVARPEDVRSDNSILSTQLSEVRIDYDGKGIGRNSAKPGILQRVLGWIF
ncbi:MAG: flagellar basal body L-ring protein FlgH [Candidatus Eisenbacteria bacterium]|uniref:Flagellar basal body L-ring protein FlgH n=1 Tax=Eiseniibacteriota bacterium TaxID=2212470 RepID=A0A956NEA6_UNCEI|nr:flagellar basal body L-ring protein FlgH [Candidatus Eisenbacteria bacterium]